MAGGGDARDTVAIRRSRLDAVVAMRRFRGAWAQLRAGTNDAAAPFWLHGRRLRAEREAERVFEMSPALLAVAGFDGYLRRFNPAFEVFGYSREELLSRPWIEFAHPNDRERMLQAAASLERGVDVVEVDNRVICRDGSLRWVEWSTRVVPEEGLFYAAGRDVTEIRRAVEEQSALRRVATLLAREASQAKVFAAIASEAMQLLRTDAVRIIRYDGETGVVLAGAGEPRVTPPGFRFPLDGDTVAGRIFRQGKRARQDEYGELSSPLAESVRAYGIRSVVGAPVLVEGRLWGAITTGMTREGRLPPDTESRLGGFTALMATAISNAEARAEVERLADEQAALRRVATLVAQGATATELCAAVAREVAEVLGIPTVTVDRYEADGTSTVMAAWGSGGFPVGSRWPLDGTSLVGTVFATGRSARIDDYSELVGAIASVVQEGPFVTTVGVPIVVDGALWGAICVGTTQVEDMPADTEARLAGFTELVATAIANTTARDALRRLAEEQAALRRVATLVAQGVRPAEIFSAVSNEVANVFGFDTKTSDVATVVRFDGGPELVLVGASNSIEGLPLGARWEPRDLYISTKVLHTGHSGRIDERDLSSVGGPIAESLRRQGILSQVGSPIIVEGRLWGAMTVNAKEELPPDSEQRLEKFTELVATAIANAENLAELAASRRRIVAAADEARRRIERDLHDGVQQQLVLLQLDLGALEADEPTGDALTEQLAILQEAVGSILDGLVEIARGIHPAILSQGGLKPALKGLARRSAVPVKLGAHIECPLPDEVEVAAYYVVSEALTNVAKYARASVVHIDVKTDDGALTLVVRDDGVGGADPGKGSGLVGLQDRVEALGGRITIGSSAGTGTCLIATLPVAPDASPRDRERPRSAK